jgi:hypothetical protein
MYLEVCLLKRIAYVSLQRFGPIVVNLASLQPLPFLFRNGFRAFLKYSYILHFYEFIYLNQLTTCRKHRLLKLSQFIKRELFLLRFEKTLLVFPIS